MRLPPPIWLWLSDRVSLPNPRSRASSDGSASCARLPPAHLPKVVASVLVRPVPKHIAYPGGLALSLPLTRQCIRRPSVHCLKEWTCFEILTAPVLGLPQASCPTSPCLIPGTACLRLTPRSIVATVVCSICFDSPVVRTEIEIACRLRLLRKSTSSLDKTGTHNTETIPHWSLLRIRRWEVRLKVPVVRLIRTPVRPKSAPTTAVGCLRLLRRLITFPYLLGRHLVTLPNILEKPFTKF